MEDTMTMTNRPEQLALAAPKSRFKPRVGGGWYVKTQRAQLYRELVV